MKDDGSAVGGLGVYLLLAGIIALAVYWKFLTFQEAYLFRDVGSDSVNIAYPQVRHLFEYLRTEGAPGWSFNQGLGQDLYPFSWNDPFLLLLFAFRGANLPFGFIYMELAKLFAAGTFFYLFLRESKLVESACVAGALLYSFSSYIVLAGAWSSFSTEAVCCALLLYALERFLRGGDWRLVPVALGLLALLQPFLLLPYALFFGPFAAVRFLDEKVGSPRACAAFLLRFFGAAVLGAALSGVFLLSDVRQMLMSPRGGDASLFRMLSSAPVFALGGVVERVTALLRLYSSDLLGTGFAFRGWANYLEAPLFYCGLSALLLAPQAFAFMDARRRKLYGALAALILLPVVFPYFRYAFWAFGGNYYRTLSLFFVVAVLLLAATAWSRIETTKGVGRGTLAATLLVLLALLYGVPEAVGAPVIEARRATIACLLIVDAALIFAMGLRKCAGFARPALLALIGFEAAWASWTTVVLRDVLTADELSAKTGYNDDTVEALAAIARADSSFYRVEKNYLSNPAFHAGLNDAKVQGYFGTTSYAQFNEPSYVAFLSEAGVVDPAKESDTRWLRGLRAYEKLMTLVGVKYFLAEGEKPVPARFAADPFGRYGDVTIYRNGRAFPLGVAFDRCLLRSEFRTLAQPERESALLDAFVVDDEAACLGFPRFEPDSAPRGEARRYDASVRARKEEALILTARAQNEVAGTATLRSRKLLFFSIPFDAGWAARVDGAPEALARVDGGLIGLPLGAGTHRVELRFVPPLRDAGAALSLAGFGVYGFLLKRRRRSRQR
jgi:hypothetical protein